MVQPDAAPPKRLQIRSNLKTYQGPGLPAYSDGQVSRALCWEPWSTQHFYYPTGLRCSNTTSQSASKAPGEAYESAGVGQPTTWFVR